MKNKFVIDTSIFLNAQTFFLLGKTPQEAFKNFLQKISHKKRLQFFMPVSVKEELLKILNPISIDEKLLLRMNCVSPKKYELKVPALFLYEFIKEMRIRINKGLRIAEKFTRKGLKKEAPEEKLIKDLRDEFREALRKGIIDSCQDVDLLLLSKQLKASLITEDEGLKVWADKLGIRVLNTKDLKRLLEL